MGGFGVEGLGSMYAILGFWKFCSSNWSRGSGNYFTMMYVEPQGKVEGGCLGGRSRGRRAERAGVAGGLLSKW